MTRPVWLGAVLLFAGCVVEVGSIPPPPGSSPTPPPAGPPAGTPVEAVVGGSFAPLAGYGTLTAGGHAQLVRISDTASTVEVHVNGLMPSTQYMAHVHALPCAFTAGGGHYKLDPSIATATETNEVWLTLMTDMKGVANASVDVPARLRGDAMSVVVHNPADSTKMLCADLDVPATRPAVAHGVVKPFADAQTADMTIAGTAHLTRAAGSTQVMLTLSGLTAGETYAAHVHALPCSVTNAGGHYMLDPTLTPSTQANELWPTITVAADGTSTGGVSIAMHVARADAQAVVIHRTIAQTPTKVACADLVPEKLPDLVAQGTSTLLQAAMDKGLTNLVLTGTMVRELSGDTRVLVAGTGLVPGHTYVAHIHALPCAIENGGGHYEIDPTAAAGRANEIWLDLPAADDGSVGASAAVAGIARPEAQAIVVHDPTDSTKLACIDLR